MSVCLFDKLGRVTQMLDNPKINRDDRTLKPLRVKIPVNTILKLQQMRLLTGQSGGVIVAKAIEMVYDSWQANRHPTQETTS